jgi:hypothetical protein
MQRVVITALYAALFGVVGYLQAKDNKSLEPLGPGLCWFIFAFFMLGGYGQCLTAPVD